MSAAKRSYWDPYEKQHYIINWDMVEILGTLGDDIAELFSRTGKQITVLQRGRQRIIIIIIV